MKFAIGKDTLVTDKDGKLEVDSKETIDALLASGFSIVKDGKVEGAVEAKEAAPVKRTRFNRRGQQ
jgi:hypothetical protein